MTWIYSYLFKLREFVTRHLHVALESCFGATWIHLQGQPGFWQSFKRADLPMKCKASWEKLNEESHRRVRTTVRNWQSQHVKTLDWPAPVVWAWTSCDEMGWSKRCQFSSFADTCYTLLHPAPSAAMQHVIAGKALVLGQHHWRARRCHLTKANLFELVHEWVLWPFRMMVVSNS